MSKFEWFELGVALNAPITCSLCSLGSVTFKKIVLLKIQTTDGVYNSKKMKFIIGETRRLWSTVIELLMKIKYVGACHGAKD